MGFLIPSEILGNNDNENESVHMIKRQEKKPDQVKEECGF
jgi:hypothetical protein